MTPGDRARTAARGLAIYAATYLAAAYLARYAVAAAAVQAVIAEWGAGWLGISWNDPRAAMPASRAIAKRAAKGFAIGIVAALLAIGGALVMRAAELAKFAPAWSVVPIGFIVVALHAVRDELVIRGVVLKVLGDGVPRAVLVLVCALAGAAAKFGNASATPIEIAIAGILAAAFAMMWLVDRGAWLACGAHAAWSLGVGPIASGGLLDVRTLTGNWGGGDAGLEGSASVAVVLLVLTCVQIAILRLRRTNVAWQ